MTSPSVPRISRRASRYQDATRLLFLLAEAGKRLSPGVAPGAVRVIRTQVRLQALDFWMRNPDYLANELLTEFEAGRMDATALHHADNILSSEEPDIRRC
jgi:hypothetical protein